jgi:hypothetical protein
VLALEAAASAMVGTLKLANCGIQHPAPRTLCVRRDLRFLDGNASVGTGTSFHGSRDARNISTGW